MEPRTERMSRAFSSWFPLKVPRECPLGVKVLGGFCLGVGAVEVILVPVNFWLLPNLAGLIFTPFAAIFMLVSMALILAFGGLLIAIGIGLLKVKNWARIILIVLAVLVALSGIHAVVFFLVHPPTTFAWGNLVAPVTTAACVWILRYLFRADVKNVFQATGS